MYTTDIGPLQARVMDHIWRTGPQTVAQAHVALNIARAADGDASLAYTTVLTVMRNLARRGMLRTDRGARAHVFAQAVERDEHRADAVRNLAALFFDGEVDALRAFAARIDELPARQAKV